MTTVGYKERYTDRDVREDPQLREIAIRYALSYGGDFEPLVDARVMLNNNEDLPTVIVRKILNSMRHDRDWADRMPVPVRSNNGAGFFEMSLKEEKYKQCDQKSPHYQHRWNDAVKWHQCKGIPYSINRPYEVRMPLRINVDFKFAIAAFGARVHRIAPNGNHFATWMPRRHHWGFDTSYIKHQMDARPSIKLLCNNPSRIVFPTLLTQGQAEDYIGELTPTGKAIEWCRACLFIYLHKL